VRAPAGSTTMASLFHSLSLTLVFSILTHASTIHYDVLGDSTNFPDPSILVVGDVSYAFATNDGAGHNIPVTSNPHFNDPSGWSALTDAFPTDGVPAFGGGGWAVEGTTWAPDVNHLTDYDGNFAMYYSPALQSNDGVHCLGLARSTNVEGPYNDSSTAPFICPEDAGGAIDASGFLDSDGSRYVVYKIDGPAANNGGYCNSPDNILNNFQNTSLMLQQVENDGYTTIGGPSVLYNNQGLKDKYNIEAPVIVKSNGVYFLFFSSGCYSDNSYFTGYVTSTKSVWGPYGKRKVLLKTGDDGLWGPGGADIDQKGRMVLHSFTASNDLDDGRVLDTGRVGFKGRTAFVK